MNTNFQLPYPAAILDQFGSIFSTSKAKTPTYTNSGLSDISYRLMIKAMAAPANSTAHYFESIMSRTAAFGPSEWAFVADEPEGKKVLVDNLYLKVVLFHWAPGSQTEIHGHPEGGGLIKVLEGSVEELRYRNTDDKHLLSEHVYRTQESAYIDDSLALHSIRNPFDKAAVTLHAYLKYR